MAAVTFALPYLPLADPLGLVPLTIPILVTLAGFTLVYVAANEIAKRHVLCALCKEGGTP